MIFLLILLFVLLGVLLNRLSNSPTSDSLIDVLVRIYLSRYVIYIVLPAIVLLKLPNLKFEVALLTPLFICWGLIPVGWLLVKRLSQFYGWSREVEGTVLLTTLFGNTSFVGMPIINAFYGNESIVYTILYDQLGSFLSLTILGNVIIAIYATNTHRQSNSLNVTKLVIHKVFTFPPFIAIFIALFLKQYPLNNFYVEILTYIAMTLIPATMILVGYYLVFKLPPNLLTPLLASLGIKMFLFPMLAFMFLVAFDQTGLVAKVSLMESAMPAMVSASILVIEAKLDAKLAAACVGYGLLLSIFTMPTIFYFSKLL